MPYTPDQEAALLASAGIGLDKIREMFQMFDADGGGSIDIEELTAAFVSLGISDTKEEIDELVQQIDADGSGEIEFAEFKEVILYLIAQRDSVAEIHKAFTYFSDGKDRITVNDLRNIALSIGDKRSEAFLEEMFHIADADHDGVVSFHDFRVTMEAAIANDKKGLVDPRQVFDSANLRDGIRL